MCGLIAIASENRSQGIPIGKILDTIAHRGPDDRGWLSWDGKQTSHGKYGDPASGRVILGHRRLSIIDLSSLGHQPMVSSNGRFAIVYNGEIYNYKELRKELEDLGRIFRSNSDTEVLLESWAEWGEDCIVRLAGMFAFTILDMVKNKLFAVRDFFGIKPLLFARWQNGVIFASELEPILKMPGVDLDLNAQKVYEYLVHGLTDHGTQTMLTGVQQLPAAHLMVVNLSDLRDFEIRRYWSPPRNSPRDISFDQAVREVREQFLENVSLHLRADVPIGVALSGGVDSSAIACAVRLLNPQADLHTFSFISDDANLSEEKWIDLVNSHTRAISHKTRPGASELTRDFVAVTASQGEPFTGTGVFAQYSVFRAARDVGIKVMLDGQGADEILGGYVRYQGSRLAELIAAGQFGRAWRFVAQASSWSDRTQASVLQFAAEHFLPAQVADVMRRLLGRGPIPSWLNRAWFLERGARLVQPRRSISARFALRSALDESVSEIGLPHLLRYEDRNSMAFSVESRVPFLTPTFVELIGSLPTEYLIGDDGESKRVFREAMRGIVPDPILDRRDKLGFATPSNRWLSDSSEWAEARISAASSNEWLAPRALARSWDALQSGRSDNATDCWRMLNLSVFSERLAAETQF